MTRFANILGTIGNTPVIKINRLAPDGIDLYVKMEAFNPLGSVKDRLALGVIEDAERRGVLKPGQTVIEATSGNTGIGLAMVCAAKGYPLVVTMAENFSVAACLRMISNSTLWASWMIGSSRRRPYSSMLKWSQ